MEKWLAPSTALALLLWLKERQIERAERDRERDLATGPGYLYSPNLGLPLSEEEQLPKGFHGERKTPAKPPW